ncbi:MAG: anti-anti-sigma factor [Aeromicrobium sp.]|jgi:anti-sigma B factor antagonist|uniref:STAS domain-containing protein n=1 Tax=Aeromicrobium sp. TaxID=1871063 RepID=UPI002636A9FF|nr:STAS domain-containing protein [Aeromicrobium sp.]MCW2823402.1 anti-anti-sigma factor [Aeromicrobium sp.]
MDLTFDVDRRGEDTAIAISGEIDLQTAPALRDLVDEMLAKGRTSIVLDMTGVTFLDSSGLGALLGIRREVQSAGGTLALTDLQAPVRKILAITRMESAFDIRTATSD